MKLPLPGSVPQTGEHSQSRRGNRILDENTALVESDDTVVKVKVSQNLRKGCFGREEVTSQTFLPLAKRQRSTELFLYQSRGI